MLLIPRKEGLTDPIALQLKESCRTTRSRWAAVLEMSGDRWKLKTSSGLTRVQQAELKQFLQMPETNAWLCGAVSVGRCRWRNITAGKPDLPGQRLYLYPCQEYPAAILIGADELQGASSAVWRVLTGSLAAKRTPAAETQPSSPGTARTTARILRLIQQVQVCAGKKQPISTTLDEIAHLIAGYYPDAWVELQVILGTERFAASSGNHPGEAILIRAGLNRQKVNFGRISVSLPVARRASSNDYLLMDIVAAILSTELALALPEMV